MKSSSPKVKNIRPDPAAEASEATERTALSEMLFSLFFYSFSRIAARISR